MGELRNGCFFHLLVEKLEKIRCTYFGHKAFHGCWIFIHCMHYFPCYLGCKIFVQLLYSHGRQFSVKIQLTVNPVLCAGFGAALLAQVQPGKGHRRLAKLLSSARYESTCSDRIDDKNVVASLPGFTRALALRPMISLSSYYNSSFLTVQRQDSAAQTTKGVW